MRFVGSQRRAEVYEHCADRRVIGDTPVFAAAISSEDQEDWVAFSRMEKSLEKIIEGSGCDSHRIYVSGGKNFRYDIDSSYKANRPKDDPIHRQACKEYLIEYWDAIETDGYEADDAVGCEQTEDTMIVGIDKDLLMIPGKHYQWPIIRGGKVVKEGKFFNISVEEGWRRFFTQAITGDKSDNIIGIKGLGPVKAAKVLEDCHTEEEMYNRVKSNYSLYNRLEDFEKNLNLLWIWREYGITYSLRKEIYGF